MWPSTMLQEAAGYKVEKQSNASIDAAPVETAVVVPSEHQPDAPGTADQRTGDMPCFTCLENLNAFGEMKSGTEGVLYFRSNESCDDAVNSNLSREHETSL